MAAKTARYAPGGAHTAGIYSDMTVDGPEIGTLVVIIDRAKNLPNRKSMGKQDPYCAARLAKEAHKTNTDKRGGQTPRWDQELRFTVRESPDYTQLKVSVFNDDKKTELIGETWISLESILVQGGGRNDVWHTLNCKGKYAGEIRIELTYYDTRPREDKFQSRKQSTQIDATPSPGLGKEGMSGPRQMKKRPLPADPTGSSPSPQVLPQAVPGLPQRGVEIPDQDPYSGNAAPYGQFQQHQHDLRQTSSSNDLYHPEQDPYNPNNHHSYPSLEQSRRHDTGNDLYERQQPTNTAQGSDEDYFDGSYMSSSNSDMHRAVQSSRYSPGRQPQTLPDLTGKIDPQLFNQPQLSNMAHSESMYEGSRPGQNSYEASPTPYRQIEQDSQNIWQNGNSFSVAEDEPPPPPPTHRHSSSRSSMPLKERQSYSSSPAMTPLNTRVDRGGSFPNSPLRTSMSSAVSPMSTSPISQRQYPSHDAISSMSSYTGPRQRRSNSPIRDSIRDREVYGDSMPPSLTPGYDPGIAAEESERLLREQQMIEQQTSRGPMPRYQQAAAVPIQQPRAQHVPRGFETISNRKERHRYSAPVPPTAPPARSQPKSANPPAIHRKSLSPQPGSFTTGRRQTDAAPSVPFGPDSFDVYNPAVNAATSINSSGAQYNSPSEAQEARLQHERKLKLGDGPIIGSDGRIIDPSDHLPTDTWAPEPEQKPARKGPEVTIRFRQNPQPQPRQPLREARPNALPTPLPPHSYSNDPSPASAARTRLQKKTRPAMAQPNSSPLLPSAYHSTSSSLRSSASDYPLRADTKHAGYNHGSSDMYGGIGGATVAVPPPVPGKVPIGSGQEDWGTDELSEEMRRIDIGIGSGGWRAGRGGGRYTTRDV